MDNLLRKHQNSIVDALIIFFTIVIAPGIFISLSRISAIGFKPEMYVHLALTVLLIFFCIYRKKIPFNIKASVTVVCFMLVGYSGIFSIGLSSSGRLDIVISIVFACTFFGLKTGMILGALNTLFVSVIAYMYINGFINEHIDFNTYNYAAKSWLAALYNFSVMGVAMVLLTGRLTQQLQANLKHLSRKTNLLRQEINQRKLTEERYRKLSQTDPLTGLNNRRYFFQRASEEILRSKRYDHSLSLIIADIDFFKRINDEHGHSAGDKALILLADTFIRIIRPSDIACRLGGEEFCVLLPETPVDDAVSVAERLRIAIKENTSFAESSLTCSFGVTEVVETDGEISQTLNRADKALYEAKASGRDQVRKL